MSDLPELSHLLGSIGREMAGAFYRLLEPRFIDYEELVRVRSPSEDFRRGIASAIWRYMFFATDAAAEASRQLNKNRERRALANRVSEARNVMLELDALIKRGNFDPERAAPVQEQAFWRWAAPAYRYHCTYGPGVRRHRRGRPVKEGDKIFVRDMAAIYFRATGKDPTIVENTASADKLGLSSPYTGSFAELLTAVQADVRYVFKLINPELPRPLSANIGRLAKGLRSHRDRPRSKIRKNTEQNRVN